MKRILVPALALLLLGCAHDPPKKPSPAFYSEDGTRYYVIDNKVYREDGERMGTIAE